MICQNCQNIICVSLRSNRHDMFFKNLPSIYTVSNNKIFVFCKMSKVETQKMQNHTKLSNNVNPAEFCIVLQFFDFYDFFFCKLIKFCKIAVCDKYLRKNTVFMTVT